MLLVLAVLAALAAGLSYRVLEEWTGRSWLPASLRAMGWGALALLLLNVSCPSVRPSARPLVLLDASLSMQAAGGRWREAQELARRSGEVRFVGTAPGDSTPSGGRSRLAPAIAAAASSGRPVVVVTDGEIEDAADVVADSLQGPVIQVLPRRPVPDVALSRVEGTTRLTPSDSLRIEVEATGRGLAGKRLELEARDAGRVWLRGGATLDSGGRATAVLRGPVPPVPPGTHVLLIAIRNAADSEPRDDTRLLPITIVPTPGVVLLASPPTWESKFLLETLRATTALPVRGYLEMERGAWRRAGDLAPVPAGEVANTARRADLLVTLGRDLAVASGSRARGRWSWPGAERSGQTGDWYVSTAAATPIGSAFLGLAVDSFPPGTAVLEQRVRPGAWVGLTAQAGRRGNVLPVLTGWDSAQVRHLVTGIDGLWRWAFRGGSSEQGYRALIASGVSWLLGGADSQSGAARLQRDVVQRGRPAVFEWHGSDRPEPVAIEWRGDNVVRKDTLVFDGGGRAEALLPPGVWRYRLAGGGQGTLAVEEYSDEWLAGPVTVKERSGGSTGTRESIPLRRWIWLFGVVVAAFAGEWLVRRRLGLR